MWQLWAQWVAGKWACNALLVWLNAGIAGWHRVPPFGSSKILVGTKLFTAKTWLCRRFLALYWKDFSDLFLTLLSFSHSVYLSLSFSYSLLFLFALYVFLMQQNMNYVPLDEVRRRAHAFGLFTAHFCCIPLGANNNYVRRRDTKWEWEKSR